MAGCIQWEEAVPLNSPGGRLPILDLQCWHSDTSGKSKIFYTFYRKPLANQLFNSAMPEQMKRTTLSQEVIRILRNCYPDLPWEEKLVHLKALTERLRDSGYPERMRAQIVESGINRWNKIKETERNGERPVNRLLARSFDKWERRKQRMKKRQNLYKNDMYSTVLIHALHTLKYTGQTTKRSGGKRKTGQEMVSKHSGERRTNLEITTIQISSMDWREML